MSVRFSLQPPCHGKMKEVRLRGWSKLWQMRPGISRVMILIPASNSYYLKLAFAFSRAFHARNMACLVYTYPATTDIECSLLEQASPDVVISINRYKSEAMLERSVRNVLWILDDFAHSPRIDFLNPPDHIPSEISYHCNYTLQGWAPPERESLNGVLMPATELPASERISGEATLDLAMVAGMFDSAALECKLDFGGAQVAGREFAEFLASEYNGNVDFQPNRIMALSNKFISERFSQSKDRTEEDVISVRDTTVHDAIPRLLFRRQCAQAMASTSRSIAFFGSRAWKTWPEFAPYYRGAVSTTMEFSAATRSSRISVHNGGSHIHPRILDSLGNGAFVMANRIREASPNDMIFEPGVSIVDYTLIDFKQIACAYLKDGAARALISHEGHRLVAANHTWHNRVQQVLSDLASI
jgi:hypothetical protein